jgi:para-nitrobenzyl esterase
MTTIVETAHGRMEGDARGGHVAFRGIPFAEPPVGPLRFAPPQPKKPWTGVRPAADFGPGSLQPPAEVAWMDAPGPKSEDCLYLNVFTPAADGSRRPVMVWIHGGGFTHGAGSQPLYDGGRLAVRGDVVVVTINYRLGALGYLYLDRFGGEGWGAAPNCGQLDQIAALRWVRENIAAFGGDPNNVTVFGESAGSFAVCALLAMPAARGLFQRAIAQSGAPLGNDPKPATRVAEAMLAEFGLAPAQSDRLREVPAEKIVEAQSLVAAQAPGMLRGYYPVADGKSLPRSVPDVIRAGEGARVPLVIGTTRDEANLFNFAELPNLDKPMEDARAAELLRLELPRSTAERIPALLDVYRASRRSLALPYSNRALIGAVQTDFRFRIPSIRLAEAYLAHEPRTYMYLFSYESPARRGALRACHALELPFVFGTLDAPTQDRFAGKGPEVERLSEHMMDAWLGFARGANPAHPALGDWPRYDRARRSTMVFDRKSRLEDAPLDAERAAWDGVI